MTGGREPKLLPSFNGLTAPPVEPVDWLVEKLLARGAGTLLFGQPGVSKTVHVAHLVACLVLGRPFCHLKTTRRRLRVLYLDFDGSWEWNHDLFLAAFRGLGCEGLPENFHYYSPNTEACSPAEDTELKSLETLGPDLALTARELGIDLVVCDSLGQTMVGDTNNGQDVALALRVGLNGARKAGAAVLVIDHATKAAAGSGGVPTPMGSQQKRAWARVSVALEKEEGQGENVTRWSVDKSNAAPFEPFLTQAVFTNIGEQLNTLDLHFVGEAGPRSIGPERLDRGQEVQQRILTALEAGPLPRAQLGERGGTLDRALKALGDAGRIVKPARGLYALPDPTAPATPHQPLGSTAQERSPAPLPHTPTVPAEREEERLEELAW
ncbi:hypothetical protein DAETH_01600 [Deinococcus aetherius]|uniref:AAA family ATPase n=1 Tax=Deinococcus aetherius TaxID=200252 RepID=A0ABN6RDA7_9DEIO|nr:AAA family ATPase [Deinococcus aetherius]BDP40191.1 hypothetical protein DAETH_01600 [Deinococcus aetherius]